MVTFCLGLGLVWDFLMGWEKGWVLAAAILKKRDGIDKKGVNTAGDITSLDPYRFPHSTWETGTNTSHSCSLETYFPY